MTKTVLNPKVLGIDCNLYKHTKKHIKNSALEIIELTENVEESIYELGKLESNSI